MGTASARAAPTPAEIAQEMFLQLFHCRLDGDDVKVSRALEQNFANRKTDIERQIKDDIDASRASQVAKWEKDLFVQKKHLADAERSLQARETKKARDDVRIAWNKIQTYLDRLADARRVEPEERHNRIFPMVCTPRSLRTLTDGCSSLLCDMHVVSMVSLRTTMFDIQAHLTLLVPS